MAAGSLTQKQRDALPASAFCGYGRSFPVLSRADICVIRKAKQFGWVGSLPQNWQDELKGKG